MGIDVLYTTSSLQFWDVNHATLKRCFTFASRLSSSCYYVLIARTIIIFFSSSASLNYPVYRFHRRRNTVATMHRRHNAFDGLWKQPSRHLRELTFRLTRLNLLRKILYAELLKFSINFTTTKNPPIKIFIGISLKKYF